MSMKKPYTAYPHVAALLPKNATFRDIPEMPRARYAPHVDWDGIERQIDRFQKEHRANLDPEFQRGHVWTREQQIAYVEYRLMGGESAGEITFVTDAWDHLKREATFMALLDGKQRLHAIRLFMNGTNPAFLRTIDAYGKNKLILRQYIHWRVIEVPNYADALGLYLQLNAGGTSHTRAEIDKVIALRAKELAKSAKKS